MSKLSCIVDAGRGEDIGAAAPSGAPYSSTDAVRSTDAARSADRGAARSDDGASPPRDTTPSGPRPEVGFGEFYSGHYGELVRLATLLSGSADAAPDLVQDCFVRLHGRWTAVRDPLPYVRRSVVHACASHHRRLARGRRLPAPETRELELGADELEDALAKLPDRQRAAIVLRYYSDLPEADIARALRCRPSTVRSLIHRGLADLRKAIEL